MEAVQTPDTKSLRICDLTLIYWYLSILEKSKKKLLSVTNIIVVDAYLSNKSFAYGILDMGFHLVSRFRDDAVLFYPTTKTATGQSGRPRLYDGKIDFKKMDLKRFKKLNVQINEGTLYSTVAYSKSLKRKVKLVAWITGEKHKLYFSTDITRTEG